MRIAFLVVVVATLAACTSIPGLPGYISSQESTFDGSTILSMEPGLVYRDNDGFSGSDLALGLYWSSAFDGDEIVMVAQVDGYKSFASEKSLQFNVDGELYIPDRLSGVPDFDFDIGEYRAGASGASSSVSYLVDADFVNEILSAERVAVKAVLSSGFVEGVFTDDTGNSAYLAFKEFMERREKLATN